MAAGFTQFNISSALVEKLHQTGKDSPTPVQEQAIPALLSGRDVICRAQTGVGKTLSFVIPLFSQLDIEKHYVQAVILSPTRELAQQTTGEIRKINGDPEFSILTVTGGRDFEEEKRKIGDRAQILVSTPGRLLDHLRKGNTSLGAVRYFVLDEVDEMVRQGFAQDIETILSLLPPVHQTMLCSATMDEEVKKISRKLTKNPLLIDVDPLAATADTVKQICIKVNGEHKKESLATLIERLNPFLMLVFCFSKEGAIALCDWLQEKGFNADVLHGDMSQNKRRQVMENFRKARLQILVASDIAARGLDVEGITQVVNYDIPHDPDWYVHRIGRTGRAGNEGTAYTFYTAEETKWLLNLEKKLHITLIRENLAGETVRRVSKPPRPRKKRVSKRGKSAVGPNKRGTKYAEASRKQKRK